MGLFDNVLGSSEAKEISPAEGFMGILMAANASDGHVSEEEVQGFFTTLLRMKMYRDWNADRLQQALDRMLGILKRKGIDTMLEVCAKAVPEKLHKCVFANACDQILADGVVEEEEKEFINKLRKALDLNGDDAQTIAQVMVYKNQG